MRSFYVVCSGGMEFTDCANPCPDRCHYLTEECTTTVECSPGCQCPAGKVLGEDGKCVEPMDCACKDMDGNVHEVSHD